MYTEQEKDFDTLQNASDTLINLINLNNSPKTTLCSIHGEAEALINGKCRKCRDEALKLQEFNLTENLIIEKKIASNIGKRYLNAKFSTYATNSDEQRFIIRSLTTWNRKKDILLLGKTGTGKSHLACALIDDCIRNGLSGYYTTFASLIDLKINERKLFKQVEHAFCLVIDEYGRGETTTKMDVLFNLLDDRYRNELPTIIISNLSTEIFKSTLGDALYSRLRENCLHHVFNWNDYRLQA